MTFLIVTHDQEEAMTVADRIAVMDKGELVQVATPAEIYEAPNSKFVADFIGDINLIEANVVEKSDAGTKLRSVADNFSIESDQVTDAPSAIGSGMPFVRKRSALPRGAAKRASPTGLTALSGTSPTWGTCRSSIRKSATTTAIRCGRPSPMSRAWSKTRSPGMTRSSCPSTGTPASF